MSQQKLKLPPFPSSCSGRGILVRKEGRGTFRARTLSFSLALQAGKLRKKNASSDCCQADEASELVSFIFFQSKRRCNFIMTGSKAVWLNNTKVYCFL